MPQLTLQQAFDLALQHHQAGRLEEAQQLYQKILAEDPQHAGALHSLGMIAHQQHRNDIAINFLRQAIALNPNWPEAHSNLGIVLKAHDKLDDAIAAHRHAIALSPNLSKAHYNLGLALKDNNQLDEAIVAFRQVIALTPDSPKAHNNLATALKEKGQFAAAILSYRRATALDPGYVKAHLNLAGVLQSLGQFDEAIASYRQAIALDPQNPQAHNNLANRLKDTGQLDQALAAYEQAIALNPNLSQAHSNLVLTLHYHPAHDARSIAQAHHRWNLQHAEPLRKFIQPHANNRDPHRRLKIGYISPDFRDHVVGRNLLPLFKHHDHGQFEITIYAQVLQPDNITAQFQKYSDHWHDIAGLSDEALAAQVRQDQIDILVDCSLHSAHNRLLVFARKPAPIQVTFAGYPAGTGLTAIYYRLSDPYLDPPGTDESLYTEKTLRLPDSFWCYDPLDERDIPINPLPASQTRIITFGCLNNFCKINDSILTLWAQILRQAPSSRLLLLAPPGSHRQRVLDFFHQQEIDPQRINFMSLQLRPDYFNLYHHIDIGLDTFPYNGHTTSLDSFWMGVPVVSLCGKTTVSRAGLSQSSNLGMPELTAMSQADYVRLAVDLSKDLPRLAELRRILRPRMQAAPLMDAPRFAHNIEAAYHRMWQTWCQSATAAAQS